MCTCKTFAPFQCTFLCFFCPQSFTGHATPVTHLLVIPSSMSHDSNANHIPSNGISGRYFISGAEQDRLLNVW